ncbi:MAG: hypothetical protein U0822_01745 [Anaerolineae bacterium]
MPIKVEVVPTDVLYSIKYDTGVLEYGILPVYLIGERRTRPRASIAGLYPIVTDLYDDGSIGAFEIWFKRQKWCIDMELVPPSSTCSGRVLVVSDDVDNPKPFFWISSDKLVGYAQSTPNPSPPMRHVRVAEQCIVDVGADDTLAGLWLIGLPPELKEHLSLFE